MLGERIVTPSAIVHLVVKLRLTTGSSTEESSKSLEESQLKRIKKLNDERDNEFLSSRKDGEDLPAGVVNKWAHAPFWPKVGVHSLFLHLESNLNGSRPEKPLGGYYWLTTKLIEL